MKSVVMVLAFVFGMAVTADQASAQIRPPEKKERQCSNAVLDTLNGKYDPTSTRRPAPRPQPQNQSPAAAPSTTPAPVVAGKSSLADRMRDRIAELKEVSQQTIEPAGSRGDAQKQIDLLKQRREDLRRKIEAADQTLTGDLADRVLECEQEWADTAEAVLDGKRRSRSEWSQLLKGLRDKANQSERSSDSNESQIDWHSPLDHYPGLPLELDPELQSADDVDPRADIKRPSLEDLKQKFTYGDRPRGMHPQDWIELQDRFRRDIAELEADLGSVTTEQRRRHALQLRDIDRAIMDAEELFDVLSGYENATPHERRDLAWRIHQARLLQLEEMLRRLDEQASTDHEVDGIVIDPLNPHRTVEDIGRRIQLAGRPAAPPAQQAQQIEPEEVPGRYPSQAQIDADGQYERMLQADIERYQRDLARLNVARERAAADIEAADEAQLSRYATDLYRNDVALGQEDETGARKALVDRKRKQLADSRRQRIDKRSDELAEDIRMTESSLQRSKKLLEEFRAEP